MRTHSILNSNLDVDRALAEVDKGMSSKQVHIFLKPAIGVQSSNMQIRAHQAKNKNALYPRQLKPSLQLKPMLKWVRKTWAGEMFSSGKGPGLGAG